MDYRKIYYSLIQDCKDTPIKQRLYRRNKLDNRIKQDRIYTENHHIVPKHDGGLDEPSNMVRMLPEEHYMYLERRPTFYLGEHPLIQQHLRL